MNLLSEDRRLASRLFMPPESKVAGPGLLFVHGLDSSQKSYSRRAERAAAAIGATCLTFDLSGHGKSAGNRQALAPTNHLSDLLAAYDLLAAQVGVDPDRIGVCGSSYGAYLAAFLTKHRCVSRILLRAPALYADGYFSTPWVQPRRSSVKVVASELSNALHGFTGNLLILESANDEVLPRGVIDWYIAANNRARRGVLEGARHALVSETEQEAFVQAIVEFFHGM